MLRDSILKIEYLCPEHSSDIVQKFKLHYFKQFTLIQTGQSSSCFATLFYNSANELYWEHPHEEMIVFLKTPGPWAESLWKIKNS